MQVKKLFGVGKTLDLRKEGTMRVSRIVAVISILFVVLGVQALGFTGEFPERPIRMIIAYSAGGGTDVLARTFQPPLERKSFSRAGNAVNGVRGMLQHGGGAVEFYHPLGTQNRPPEWAAYG